MLSVVYELYRALIKSMAEDIIDACIRYNASITSGFRTVKHNTDVNGSINSWHLDGLAYDVLVDNKDDIPMFKYDLELSGYRVLDIEGNELALHVQPDWPVIGFERKDVVSHLAAILKEGF